MDAKVEIVYEVPAPTVKGDIFKNVGKLIDLTAEMQCSNDFVPSLVLVACIFADAHGYSQEDMIELMNMYSQNVKPFKPL